MLLASVELGGTKTIAAIGHDPVSPLASVRIDTRGPAETLDDVEAFFRRSRAAHGTPVALGIASFGPVILDRDAADWGRIADTPKPGWRGADIARRLGRALDCPVAIDTDVGAAVLAEARLGAGQGCDPLVYLTVGTGIGGGLYVAGQAVRGLLHPEMGHMLLRRHPDDAYPGGCPYHGDCVEGLASGPSIVARYGVAAGELPGDHPFRAILADYLGQLCAVIVLVASPERILIGGGVMEGTATRGSPLHEDIADAMRGRLGGYIDARQIGRSGLVARPVLADAGLVGGFVLARMLVEQGAEAR